MVSSDGLQAEIRIDEPAPRVMYHHTAHIASPVTRRLPR